MVNQKRYSLLFLSVLLFLSNGCGPGLPVITQLTSESPSTSSPTGPLSQQTNTNADDRPYSFKEAGSRVFFIAHGGTGLKVFSYDGSELKRISDTNPNGHDEPSDLTVVGENLYFKAYNGVAYKVYLYQPGIDQIAQVVSNINPGKDDEARYFTATANGLYFWARNASGFEKLYYHRPG